MFLQGTLVLREHSVPLPRGEAAGAVAPVEGGGQGGAGEEGMVEVVDLDESDGEDTAIAPGSSSRATSELLGGALRPLAPHSEGGTPQETAGASGLDAVP